MIYFYQIIYFICLFISSQYYLLERCQVKCFIFGYEYGGPVNIIYQYILPFYCINVTCWIDCVFGIHCDQNGC